jgi:hypothetical protein
MALKPCRECRKEVSDEAKTCPHCGTTLKRGTSWAFVLLAMFVGCGACVSIFRSGGGAPPVAAPVSPAVGAPVELRWLVESYDSNEVASDMEYKGRRIRVSGTVVDIAKDITDDAYIIVGPRAKFRAVQCLFERGDTAQAARLRKGQAITVDGDVSGLMMNVLLRRCAVVE